MLLYISLFLKYIFFDIRYIKCSFPMISNPSASLRSIHLLSWDSIEIPARRYRCVSERRVASPTLEAFPGAVKRSLFSSIRLFVHFTFFLPSDFAFLLFLPLFFRLLSFFYFLSLPCSIFFLCFYSPSWNCEYIVTWNIISSPSQLENIR